MVMRDGKLVHIIWKDIEEEKRAKIHQQELARGGLHQALTVIGSRLFRVRTKRQGN
ncbi:hypothetical protein ES703_15779 [subsurface metagenome]